MALKKASVNVEIETIKYNNFEELKNYYHMQSDINKKHVALNEMTQFEDGRKFLVSVISTPKVLHETIAYISSLLSAIDPKIAPIDNIIELLKIEDAYVRNTGIEILQHYGSEIKYYLVKYLIGDDSDLRIFAVNVLGDVNFSESRDMLCELLESEDHINTAMTAVDYMGDIGKEEDIELLESLKVRFDNEPYVVFCVDNAIKSIKG